MTKELLECGHYTSKHSPITTGYRQDKDGNRHCYACCAENDKQDMRTHGNTVLYLTKDDDGRHYASNWPSSLKIPVTGIKKGRHNFAMVRYDGYFIFEGYWWHGVQYGDNTQLFHCKRTKEQFKQRA